MQRTHTCGDLNLTNLHQPIVLQGWIKKIRKMGGLTFIDLRDRYGITQLKIDENKAKNLHPEDVIQVQGIVEKRPQANKQLATGEIEVIVESLKIISHAKVPPFPIENSVSATEETRLKYRYLDLRRQEMQSNLLLRAKLNSTIRKFFEQEQFLEVETPYLAKATPEGARDFLVPSRLNQDKFYALPQSPQLFKQLLMIAGLDRYYQIVRCFRDEDLRADRQLEFTQLDMEMAFATNEDVMFIIDQLMSEIFSVILDHKITLPIPRLTYKEAMESYGSDKPDLRFELKIHNLTKHFKTTQAKFFQNLGNDFVQGLGIDELLSKKQLTQIEEAGKQNHLPNLAILKITNGEWTGGLAAQLSSQEKTNLLKEFGLKNQGTILLTKGKNQDLLQALGMMRLEIAKIFNLANPNAYNLVWIVDFPLFEWSEEEGRFQAAHHPFTMPRKDYEANFHIKKAEALASAYDLVINGFEVGGGSQRIADPEMQKLMFEAIGLTPAQAENNFGWFLEAYDFGAPYHAGLALGLDRIAMILTQSNSIRDVIAFPKNASGIDPMSSAPGAISKQQLAELHLKLEDKRKD